MNSTSIVSNLQNFVENKKSNIGILEKIQNAKTKTEIELLMESVKNYKHISNGTLRKIAKVAALKEVQLSNVK